MSEYFQLRDYMNKANRLSNQVTEIRFEVEAVRLHEYALFAVSFGKNETHRLAVAERAANKTWERTGNTRFHNLEEFCARCLNELEKNDIQPIRTGRLPGEIKEWLGKEISARLRMLLLNENYEP